jgi:hypothetical protein
MVPFAFKGIVRNAAQESEGTHLEAIYSMVWLSKPKNITTISSMQIII